MRLPGPANHDVAARRPCDRSAHEQQIFFGVNFHDAQTLRRLSLVSHVPRKMLAFPHARGERTGADSAGRAVKHRAVRPFAAAIVPALDASLKSLALANAAHVHEFADL